jgi:hypothetical protein
LPAPSASAIRRHATYSSSLFFMAASPLSDLLTLGGPVAGRSHRNATMGSPQAVWRSEQFSESRRMSAGIGVSPHARALGAPWSRKRGDSKEWPAYHPHAARYFLSRNKVTRLR